MLPKRNGKIQDRYLVKETQQGTQCKRMIYVEILKDITINRERERQCAIIAEKRVTMQNKESG